MYASPTPGSIFLCQDLLHQQLSSRDFCLPAVSTSSATTFSDSRSPAHESKMLVMFLLRVRLSQKPLGTSYRNLWIEFAFLGNLANAILLCLTCHRAFDSSVPSLTIVPSDIASFIAEEDRDYRRSCLLYKRETQPQRQHPQHRHPCPAISIKDHYYGFLGP